MWAYPLHDSRPFLQLSFNKDTFVCSQSNLHQTIAKFYSNGETNCFAWSYEMPQSETSLSVESQNMICMMRLCKNTKMLNWFQLVECVKKGTTPSNTVQYFFVFVHTLKPWCLWSSRKICLSLFQWPDSIPYTSGSQISWWQGQHFIYCHPFIFYVIWLFFFFFKRHCNQHKTFDISLFISIHFVCQLIPVWFFLCVCVCVYWFFSSCKQMAKWVESWKVRAAWLVKI